MTQPPDLAELAAAAREQGFDPLTQAPAGLTLDSLPGGTTYEWGYNAGHAAGLAEGRSEREARVQYNYDLGYATGLAAGRVSEQTLRDAQTANYDQGHAAGLATGRREMEALRQAVAATLAAHPTPPDSIDDTQRAEEAGR